MIKFNNITLYHRSTCPFCIRVRRFLKANNIVLDERDINIDGQALKKLITEGGKRQVPAITIEDDAGNVKWLYESNEIIDYLARKVAREKAA